MQSVGSRTFYGNGMIKSPQSSNSTLDSVTCANSGNKAKAQLQKPKTEMDRAELRRTDPVRFNSFQFVDISY
jgi:hypothetical protein